MKINILKTTLILALLFSSTSLYACSCEGAKAYAKEIHAQKDRLPPHKLARLVLECTGVMPYVKHLDMLDQDLIYMKATYKTKEEYAQTLTSNASPKKFSDIIPKENRDKLYKVIDNIFKK